MIELEPATSTLTALLKGVRDDQLTGPTPCDGFDMAALLSHVEEMTLTSVYAATRTSPEGNGESPAVTVSQLADDWRRRTPQPPRRVGERVARRARMDRHHAGRRLHISRQCCT